MRTLIILIAALFLAACEQSDPPEIVAAKSVLPYVRDAGGAVFRLPPVQKEITEKGDFYCGMMSGPNGYGGMSGLFTFSVYIIMTEDGVAAEFYEMEEAHEIRETNISVADFCETAGYPSRLLFEAPEWRPPVPER